MNDFAVKLKPAPIDLNYTRFNPRIFIQRGLYLHLRIKSLVNALYEDAGLINELFGKDPMICYWFDGGR